MYCWEIPLLDKVKEYRAEEMKRLLIRMKYYAVNYMLYYVTPPAIALLTFIIYVSLGNELKITTVFEVITLIQLLRIAIRVLPTFAKLYTESKVGIQRLQKFFN